MANFGFSKCETCGRLIIVGQTCNEHNDEETKTIYRDAWSGNPDTDKYWSK